MKIFLSMVVVHGKFETEHETQLATHTNGNLVVAETEESATKATIRLVQRSFPEAEGYEIVASKSIEIDPEKLREMLDLCTP